MGEVRTTGNWISQWLKRRLKRPPIYVETMIRTDLDTIWKHTQEPDRHVAWDLRFSSITYEPQGNKVSDQEEFVNRTVRAGQTELMKGIGVNDPASNTDAQPQHFTYRTNIGFGLSIAGAGIASSKDAHSLDQRISILSFHSNQSLSLINRGQGYWKYKQQDEGIQFLTQYDYATRWGWLGASFDRLIFRPLFGWATAWSFDALRLWLERGIHPSISVQRTILHYMSVCMLSFMWIYHGLVPKLLMPGAGEYALMEQTLGAASTTLVTTVLIIAGSLEILAGMLLWRWHRSAWPYWLKIIVLPLLAILVMIPSPAFIGMPFNPVTLTVAMMGSSLVALLSRKDLPNAANCLRKRPVSQL